MRAVDIVATPAQYRASGSTHTPDMQTSIDLSRRHQSIAELRARMGPRAWSVVALLACGATAITGPEGLAWRLIGAPCAEEIIFRAGVQSWLLAYRRSGRVSGFAAAHANFITAIGFALAHLAVRPCLLSLLTAVPALAIGRVFQSSRRVRDCVVLHALCNTIWFACASQTHASALTP